MFFPGAEYDAEYTVPLADWYNTEHAELMRSFLSPSNPEGHEPVPDAPLIDNKMTQSVYVFEPGKRYRLRFINMAAIAMFDVWIDDHEMTIIEVDGVQVYLFFIQVNPYKVSSLPIAAAQRYSVIVTAKQSTYFNYKLHAKFDQGMFYSPSRQPSAYASIIYNPSYPYSPEIQNPSSSFDDTSLKSVYPQYWAQPDVSHCFNANFSTDSTGVNRGQFNGISFKLPSSPLLLTNQRSPNPGILEQYEPWLTNAHILPLNQIVQIVINNLDSNSHPFQYILTNLLVFTDTISKF